jgi:hypothetical protein
MQKHHALGFIKVTTPSDDTFYVRASKIDAVLQQKNADNGVNAHIAVGGGTFMVKNQPGAIISQIEEVPPELR